MRTGRASTPAHSQSGPLPSARRRRTPDAHVRAMLKAIEFASFSSREGALGFQGDQFGAPLQLLGDWHLASHQR